ncbi:MAG: type II toxin-antitoxin system HicB family antitoxin [Dehalococcoidia bacterium]|nr:type II toxin-antitoxin system HicB family antitoxin [Dehalococcoidia bacterium]
MRTFTVVLSPDPETGGYSVTCPAMPGAVSQGESREETLRNIQEAMELWLEVSSDGSAETPLPETPDLIAGEVAWVLGWRAEEGWPLVVETATITLPTAVAA